MSNKLTPRVRVSKEEVEIQRAELRQTSYQRKRKIVPGPWTNVETDLTIELELRPSKSIVFDSPVYGSYKSIDWDEKGWYPVVINLQIQNVKDLVSNHGIDNVLAAAEKALTAKKNTQGKSLYGTVIILKIEADYSLSDDNNKRFISVCAKTNKKNIHGFVGVRQNKYKIIGEDDDECGVQKQSGDECTA